MVWLAPIISYGVIAVLLVIGWAAFSAARQMLVGRPKSEGTLNESGGTAAGASTESSAAVAILDTSLHGQSDRTNRIRDFASGRLGLRARRAAALMDFCSCEKAR
jgi:hypothetical protein